ncbi:hypothetical protein [Rhodococcus opacus]|uniref:ATP dependent DNA ligase n=1 Tax=Rhodococcus opacus TaxID=37919 RepID=UPI003AF69030
MGHVGTGFTTATRKSLRGQLAAIERPTTPLDSPPPARDTRRVRAGSNHGWSAMSSTANTPAGGLRHPSWKGLRDDKAASEVDLPGRH